MNGLTRTFIISCLLTFAVLNAADPRREKPRLSIKPAVKNLAIEELQYTSKETTQKGKPQITDKFTFQIPNWNYYSDIPASLRLFDYEERVWVDASVDKNQSRYCFKRNECTIFGCSFRRECKAHVTLEKPLIGYDLLKSGGCDGEEFKTQPFTKGRWGAPEEEEEDVGLCYLITISSGGQSVAQMYPENCSQKKVVVNTEHHQLAAAPFLGRQSRSTSSHSITQFTKQWIGGFRKFVCKVRYTHMGGPVDLGFGIPTADVKVYYKNDDGASWGSHLLDLSWVNYNNDGVNKFESRVSKGHLQEQGVKWNKCFKCEVEINDEMERSCLGDCDCD